MVARWPIAVDTASQRITWENGVQVSWGSVPGQGYTSQRLEAMAKHIQDTFLDTAIVVNTLPADHEYSSATPESLAAEYGGRVFFRNPGTIVERTVKLTFTYNALEEKVIPHMERVD